MTLARVLLAPVLVALTVLDFSALASPVLVFVVLLTDLKEDLVPRILAVYDHQKICHYF